MRARGKVERDRQVAQQHVGGVPTDPLKIQVGTYLDNLRENANYTTQIVEGIYSHLGVIRPHSMPPQ